MQFNEKLKKLRNDKGLTQAELADKVFVSRSAVAKWESGLGLPSDESLTTLAEFLGVEQNELLSDPVIEKIVVEKNNVIYINKRLIGAIVLISFIFIATMSAYLYSLLSRAPIPVKTIITLTQPEVLAGEQILLSAEVRPDNATYKQCKFEIEYVEAPDGTRIENTWAYAYIDNLNQGARYYLCTTNKILPDSKIYLYSYSEHDVVRSQTYCVKVMRRQISDVQVTYDANFGNFTGSDSLRVGDSIKFTFDATPSHCSFNAAGESASVTLLTPELASLQTFSDGKDFILTANLDNDNIGKQIQVEFYAPEGYSKIFTWTIKHIDSESVALINADTGEPLNGDDGFTYIKAGSSVRLKPIIMPENAVYDNVVYTLHNDDPYISVTDDGILTISEDAENGHRANLCVTVSGDKTISKTYYIIVKNIWQATLTADNAVLIKGEVTTLKLSIVLPTDDIEVTSVEYKILNLDEVEDSVLISSDRTLVKDEHLIGALGLISEDKIIALPDAVVGTNVQIVAIINGYFQSNILTLKIFYNPDNYEPLPTDDTDIAFENVRKNFKTVVNPLYTVAKTILDDLIESGDVVLDSARNPRIVGIRYCYGLSFVIIICEDIFIYESGEKSEFLQKNTGISLNNFSEHNGETYMMYRDFLHTAQKSQNLENYVDIVQPLADRCADLILNEYNTYKANKEIEFHNYGKKLILRADSSLSETYNKIINALNVEIAKRGCPLITNQDIEIGFGINKQIAEYATWIIIQVRVGFFDYFFNISFNENGEFSQNYLNYYKGTMEAGYTPTDPDRLNPRNEEYAELFDQLKIEKMKLVNRNGESALSSTSDSTYLYF